CPLAPRRQRQGPGLAARERARLRRAASAAAAPRRRAHGRRRDPPREVPVEAARVTAEPESEQPGPRVRLDKWLWAARFCRPRSGAGPAVDGGKVDIGGARAKRSRLVQVGEVIVIRRPPYEQHLVVRGLSETRGPAKEAALLYEETKESREARDKL